MAQKKTEKKTTKKTAKKPAKKPAARKTTNPKNAAQEDTSVGEQQIAGPMLRVLAQYTKDASFENPNAPESLRADLPPPSVAINIEIGRQMIDENTAEVVLMLGVQAERDGKPVFLCELEYAGLFGFAGIAEEHLQPMILIECPRLLFPFARQIIAEMTQNGGFPPILMEPPDFAAMFRDEMMRRAASGEETVN